MSVRGGEETEKKVYKMHGVGFGVCGVVRREDKDHAGERWANIAF